MESKKVSEVRCPECMKKFGVVRVADDILVAPVDLNHSDRAILCPHCREYIYVKTVCAGGTEDKE